MRIRAARASLAFALTAALAVCGFAASHAGARSFVRPVVGTVAAPAQAAVSGLPGLHGHRAHDRTPAIDVVPAPAPLLAMLLLVAVVVRRSRFSLGVAASAAHARGPPAVR